MLERKSARRRSLVGLAMAPALIGPLLTLAANTITARAAETCVVNSNADSSALNANLSCLAGVGQITLRSAIEHFNNIGGTNTITFSLPNPSSILLERQLIVTNSPAQNLTITGGTTPAAIVVDAQAPTLNHRVFEIQGATVSMSGLTIQHGKPPAANGFSEGGGIVNRTGGNLSLDNVVVTANEALVGAGIANRGTLALTRSIVSGNTSGENGAGAGLVHRGTSTATITDTTISGNTVGPGAFSAGGGVIADEGGTLTLDRVTVSNNSSAGDGGGLLLGGGAQGAAPTVSLTNVTVSGNSAGSKGGGIKVATQSTVQPQLINATVSGNSAGTQGGGIDVPLSTFATAKNTIISGNTAGKEPNCGGSNGIVVSQGHNIENGTSCNQFRTAADTPAGTDFRADPLLEPLSSNPPGSLQTHALKSNSPAVDQADAAACPAVDERGVQRKLDGACDIGAYEFIAAATTPAALSPAQNIPVPTLPKAGAPSPTGNNPYVLAGALAPPISIAAWMGLRRRRRAALR